MDVRETPVRCGEHTLGSEPGAIATCPGGRTACAVALPCGADRLGIHDST